MGWDCDLVLWEITEFHQVLMLIILWSYFIIELLRKKRKVEKENSRLAAEVEELKQRLANLERASSERVRS